MRSLIFIVFFAFLQISVFSQVNLSGSVSDIKGQPLAGATVLLKGTYLGVITDANGKFLFKNLKKGDYVLSISFIGYETNEQKLSIQKDAVVNVSLKEKPLVTDEVIVSAQRASNEIPVAKSNLNKDDIAMQNMGQDMPVLMKLQPSVVTTSDAGAGVGYTGFRIRGVGIRGINVTINGIPLNDPESQGVWWVDVPDLSSSTENIQIQRGVGTSTNGAGAFGATININTTNSSSKPYGEINSFAGSYHTFKNNVKFGTGLINKRISIDGSFSKISSNGYIDRSFSNLKSMSLTTTYHGDNSLLKFVVLSGKEKTYQAWNGVPKIYLDTNRTYNSYTYDNETDNYQQDHYQLLYSKRLNGHLFFNASAFYIYGRGYYENYKKDQSLSDYLIHPVNVLGTDTVCTTINSSDLITRKWLDNDYYGSNLSLKYNLEKLNIVGGVSGNYYDGRHFGRVIWSQYAGDSKIRHEWYRGAGIKKDYNGFTKINYRLLPQLNLYADLQYRYIHYVISGTKDDLSRLDSSAHIYNFFNPKFGWRYKLNDKMQTYFLFAVAHREPSRDNFKDADFGKTPKPETLLDYELGYKANYKQVLLQANLYYMDYKDQLINTGEINNVGSPIMTNVAESFRSGVELESAVKITKALQWNLNLTLSQNKIKNYIDHVDNWDAWYDTTGTEPYQFVDTVGTTDISFSPSIIMATELSFAHNGFKVSLSGKYIGRQYIDNTSNVDRSLAPYFVSDLMVAYSFHTKLFKEVQIKLKVNNLLNEKYVTNAWVYQYKSGDGSYDGSYGDIFSTPASKPGYYNMAGYFPQALINVLGGISIKF